MPMRRECVCCRQQPEAENKMEGRIFSIYCIGRDDKNGDDKKDTLFGMTSFELLLEMKFIFTRQT